MTTQVYANGLEIACKAAGSSGISPQAFPDPCWSPPPPAPGPVVIPYPNTCVAGDITNGTSTVRIMGKEVAVEDKSYFSTSTGNEPATPAFSKGVKTGVIKGKAYFTQWSFDVAFEGLGVPRHQDLVGHNHGSMPSNTAVFPYLARGMLGGHECRGEDKRIKRACEKEDDQSDLRKEVRKKNKAHDLLKQMGGKQGPRPKGEPWHWTNDHCDGMQVNINSYDKAEAYAQQMKKAYEDLPQMLNVMEAVELQLKETVMNAGKKAAAKLALRTGAKQAVGSVVPLAGNVAMGVVSLVDAGMTISDVNELRRTAKESLQQLKTLREKASELQAVSERFKNLDSIKDGKEVLKLVADGQDVLATINECTRARKCNLVPKSQKGGNNARNVETADGKGCCPGQTGHHLIYGAMMDGVDCPGYKYETAPTVCVEGFSQHHGSHGRVHDAMDREVQLLKRQRKLVNDTMSMQQTIDAAAKSHAKSFPLSRCSTSCIKAQLEAYYKCPTARPKALNKQGKPFEGDTGGGVL